MSIIHGHNERATEDIVRGTWRDTAKKARAKIYEQVSPNDAIRRCLAQASKSGSKNAGRPEFIVEFGDHGGLLVVAELKAKLSQHGGSVRAAAPPHAVSRARPR